MKRSFSQTRRRRTQATEVQTDSLETRILLSGVSAKLPAIDANLTSPVQTVDSNKSAPQFGLASSAIEGIEYGKTDPVKLDNTDDGFLKLDNTDDGFLELDNTDDGFLNEKLDAAMKTFATHPGVDWLK